MAQGPVRRLAPGECEVLYWRAGYLWALLWVRAAATQAQAAQRQRQRPKAPDRLEEEAAIVPEALVPDSLILV
jgi:hypothetical protein